MPIHPPLPVADALQVGEIPQGPPWQYEPKWDGFRCVAFRDGGEIYLQSKSFKPLARYFPDVVAALAELPATRFVLDGEIVIAVEGDLSFEELQLRLHPAASRVQKLAAAHPATYIAFDLLVDQRGRSLLELPLRRRRPMLEAFAASQFAAAGRLAISPASADLVDAQRWLGSTGGGLDGIIAKRLDAPYGSGNRETMVKVKNIRSADCVVAGFRYGIRGRTVASLLLGLYGDDGLLHHVGFTASIPAAQRAALTARLQALQRKAVGQVGFTGREPGGPSRWAPQRSGDYESLPHELVVEVSYDHFTGGRFRHAAGFLRWRPDKAPRQCLLADIQPSGESSAKLLA